MRDSEVIEEEVVQVQETEGEVERGPASAAVRAIAVVTLALGVVMGLHAYVGARLVAGLRLSGAPAQIVWATLWGLFLSIFAAFFARRLPRPAGLALRWVAYVWLGVFVQLVCAVAVTDVASAAVAVAVGRPLAEHWGPVEVLAALALVVPAVAWGTLRALGPARIERLALPIAGLPTDLDGFRIIQLSDLHIGEMMGRAFAQRIVEQVNALAPDLVAVTGDLADGNAAHVRSKVEPLGGLEASEGVFFVTGNHEYYNGLADWLAEVRCLGMHVLLNEHRVICRGAARLVVGGVTDYNAGDIVLEHASRPDVAFAGAPEGAPRILLAHQPRSAFQAGGLGIALQLSGHTHGGQFFPWGYFVRLQQPVLAGLSVLNGVRVYTHRGTGFCGPPLRLFAPPEITEITLVRAGS